MGFIRLEFSRGVRASYNANTYHSWEHAFSTFHLVFNLINCDNCKTHILDVDSFATLCAALGHDADHPGLNNNFEVNSRSKLAMRYNDESVLESHHAAVTCGILYQGDKFY